MAEPPEATAPAACVSAHDAAALHLALTQTATHLSNGVALPHQSLCRALSSLERISASSALQLSSCRISMVASLRRCDAAQAEMQMSRDYLAANDCRESLNGLLKLLNSSCDVVESYAFKLQQRNITKTRLPSSIHKTADAITKTAESITAGVASLASKAPALHRLHLSRSADADDASAQPQPVTAVVVHPPVTAVVVHPPVTAVVVHPPPFHESPQPRAAAAAHRDDGVAASDPNADAAAANSSPFSLFGVLARWNKEDDGTLRVQEVHEQESALRSRGLGLMQATASSRSASSNLSRAKARSKNSGNGW